MFFDSTSTPRYDYIIRDHLGNTRVVFSDLNGDEVVDSTEILSQHHYYAFGMEMEGEWNAPQEEPYRYSYNGKELNRELDLNWLSYGAREYDPSIGRFIGVDPIADQFPHLSPFNYASNDPIKNVDLHGLQGVPFSAATFKSSSYNKDQHAKTVREHLEAQPQVLAEVADILVDEIPFVGEIRAALEGDGTGVLMAALIPGGRKLKKLIDKGLSAKRAKQLKINKADGSRSY